MKFIKNQLKSFKEAYRTGGWRAAVRQLGWKSLLILITYYLIRDTILYILIPYLVARQFFIAFDS